jgi:riboflavin synthase
VCLTVVENRDGAFTADVMSETLERSSLGVLTTGSPVNLERAVRTSATGSAATSCRGTSTAPDISRSARQHWTVVRLALPRELTRYVVEKGSITVDGVSLTVSAVGARLARGQPHPHHRSP